MALTRKRAAYGYQDEGNDNYDDQEKDKKVATRPPEKYAASSDTHQGAAANDFGICIVRFLVCGLCMCTVCMDVYTHTS